MDKNAVRKLLAKEIKKLKSQKAWADKHELSPAYVCDMMHGRRDFSERVLELLGLEIDYRFKKPN